MEKTQEVDILSYLHVIWKRLWLIFLMFFLIAGIVFAVSSLMDEVYETEIVFRIIGRQRSGSGALSQIPSSALTTLGFSGGERDLQTYSHVLKSKNITNEVIEAIPYLEKAYPVQPRSGLSGKIKDIVKPYNKDARDQIGENGFRRRLLLKALRSNVKVRQPGGDVLSVKVQWDDPKVAADIANALGNAFIKYDRSARQEATERTLSFIQNALDGTELEETDPFHSAAGVEQLLIEAEEKLRDFKMQHKTVAMQEEAKKLIEKLVDAESTLSSSVITRKTSEARLSDIQKQLKEQDQMVVSAKTITDNPMIKYLRQEMTQLEIQAESLRANLGEANPELKDLETQVAEYEKRVRQLLEDDPRIISQETSSANPLYQFFRKEEINCLMDITILQIKEIAIQERITYLEGELAKIPDEEMQLAALTREANTYSKIYTALRQSESEAQLARESITTNISVLDEPDIPLEPIAPKTALNTVIGGIIGLMLGLGLAFFLEYVKRVRSSRDRNIIP